MSHTVTNLNDLHYLELSPATTDLPERKDRMSNNLITYHNPAISGTFQYKPMGDSKKTYYLRGEDPSKI